MKRTAYTYCPLLLMVVWLSGMASCSSSQKGLGESLVQYIDTRVGTAPSSTHTAGMFGKHTEEYGQTLPAVLEPNGMNFWTPQTQDTEQKCMAPYYYKDSLLQGFRNSHWIVGGCTQDYGSMTLMPLFERLRCTPQARASRFSHEDEEATPAYYATTLPDEGIRVEMTGRSRSAIFRFTYSQAGKGYLVVNPNSDEGQGYITIDTLNKQIIGYNPVHRIYQGWGEAAGYSGYFVISLQKKITDYGTFKADSLAPRIADAGGAPQIGVYVEFDVTAGEEILVKAASSFTSQEGALQNLKAEIPHWDFNRTHEELTRIWEQHLATVQVETDHRVDKEKFYSAFYRASFLPRTVNDADRRYPSFAKGTPIRRMPDGETYYDDYSMWDTYRALHPLVNLLFPTRGGEMMQSLVLKYEQGGWLPIFPCWNSYTAAMIGDHCLSAIGDAYCKGIRNFNIEKAYEGMRRNAFEIPSDFTEYRNGMGRRALASYLKYGYIPLEDSVPDAFHTREQTSRTLEYAYDDFVLAQVAKALDKTADYQQLMQRATNYRRVIDPRTGYAQGRRADGTFLNEDNAFSFARFITEGAPCHYTWYAPQDPYGLMECMGGKDNYVLKLDSMFGQQRYWHGNEPCHQVAFMFNYAGQPWKTQRAVRHIMETEYLNAPGGLSGNDDAGQMSAWYMFAAMGFYPVCPGTPYYLLASPSFPSLTLNLENGKTFTVKAQNVSEKNIYIQSVLLDGKPYTRNYISHQQIVDGGIMEFVMGESPNETWGSQKEDCPPSVM
ncbi:GH92 family glycosyl hydrolase [Bacteroides sp.]|uniref:GH92 family glycosyl hydrolase n=1 Tax=Bacteroides sp. TaxID=29523 RepID=UPI0026274C3B|nr:GH92 family glycosyl hydrolase [Bacteroides sp.]